MSFLFTKLCSVVRFNLLAGLFILITSVAKAETLTAYFEPFPPFITSDGKGIISELFAQIEQDSDIEFNIQMATTHRIRTLISQGDADLIGLFAISPPEMNQIPTPVVPLAITFLVKNDIYTTKASNLELNNFKSLTRIGVPYGNAGFVSKLVGISGKQIYQQNMHNLCKMLAAGRIDALTYERGATMSCIQKYKLENIHYKLYPEEPVVIGFLVKDDIRGRQIKSRLDSIIARINIDIEMTEYNYFLNLPDTGIVPCCSP